MPLTDESERSLDDRELMRSIAKGHNSELGRLYLRHQEKVLALAYRILGQWNLAEDISQETFLRVQRAAQAYRPDAEFTTWLYRIVVNLCLDEQRRQKRMPIDNMQTTELLRITTDDPGSAQEKTEQIAAICKALSTLNKRQQKAVVLHKIEGLSHAEISKKTGWSQSSVESLLVRAYRKLRNELTAQNE